MKYQILWDNGHASDVFPTIYSNKREAEKAAAQWKRDMVAIDHNPHQARMEYQWEIVTVGEPDDSIQAHEIEGSLAHFNRYIAGDR